MSAPLADWRKETRIRRREHELGEPFHTGIVNEGVLDRERVSRAAAIAIVGLVARRPVSVTFEPGASYADTRHGRVNLDPTVLARAETFGVALEHLFALAGHEGGHERYTKTPSAAAGRLFHWLHNVLEDERVECLVVRDFLPLAHPLFRARSDLLQVDGAADGMLSALFVLVRAPERMPPGLWRRHERFLRRVIEILTPFPWTQRAMREAIRRIIELLPASVRKGELPPLPVFGYDSDVDSADDDLFAIPDRLRRLGLGRGRVLADRLERYPRVEWLEAAPDPAGYERLRRESGCEARVFAEGLRSLLPPRSMPRARRGNLDRRRLHAWRYDERLFRAARERDDRLALALVIDLSASMRGESARAAQRIAVGVAEGAALLHGVRLYVYGHRADSGGTPSTDIVRFAAPARGRVEGLGRLPIGNNNRDAHALEVIGRDLLKREGARRTPRVAMVICDGLPEARGFHGRVAVEATRRSLSWLEQVWGPPLLVLTRDAPTLRQLIPGPYLRCDERNSMRPLVGALAGKLRRARA